MANLWVHPGSNLGAPCKSLQFAGASFRLVKFGRHRLPHFGRLRMVDLLGYKVSEVDFHGDSEFPKVIVLNFEFQDASRLVPLSPHWLFLDMSESMGNTLRAIPCYSRES
jgi:hypothetical protein